MCLYLWGWAIYIVKLLVLMRSEGNRNYSGRRPEKQKANKRKVIFTWKSNGYWKFKKKNVLSLELSSSCFYFFVSLQSTIVVSSTVKLSDRSFFQLFFHSEWWEAVSSKWTAISCWIITVEQRFQNLSQIIVWVLLAPCSSCSLSDRANLGLTFVFSLALGLLWSEGCQGQPQEVRDEGPVGICQPIQRGSSANVPFFTWQLFPSICRKYLLWKEEKLQAGFGACSQKK